MPKHRPIKYHYVKITVIAKVADHRIDDQNKPENREWKMTVWDRNLDDWLSLPNERDKDRYDEFIVLDDITYLPDNYEVEIDEKDK